MRDEAAGLHGKNEVPGSSVSPGLESFNRGQAVEAVVQFQRVKVQHIIFEHLRRRRLCRIKRSYPMLVVITGRANTDVSSHVSSVARDPYPHTLLRIWLDAE